MIQIIFFYVMPSVYKTIAYPVISFEFVYSLIHGTEPDIPSPHTSTESVMLYGRHEFQINANQCLP
jgi:hypothetical protein